MCHIVAVRRVGEEDICCQSVGELAKVLKLRPIEISPDEDEDCCLCNARLDELGAKRTDTAYPDYIIELPAREVPDVQP